MSGGFPHSEITGSKPIPGSPVLIAGYHVLHRLLLPRHPPNALLALDPTRKERGTSARLPDRKQYYPGHAPLVQRAWPVSVLDLERYRFRAEPGELRHSAAPRYRSFLSLNDVKSRPEPDGQASRRDACRSGSISPTEGNWWVEEDSNLRPHAYQACALTT